MGKVATKVPPGPLEKTTFATSVHCGAAMFGVSPTAVISRRSPPRCPTITGPVSIPARTAILPPSGKPRLIENAPDVGVEREILSMMKRRAGAGWAIYTCARAA